MSSKTELNNLLQQAELVKRMDYINDFIIGGLSKNMLKRFLYESNPMHKQKAKKIYNEFKKTKYKLFHALHVLNGNIMAEFIPFALKTTCAFGIKNYPLKRTDDICSFMCQSCKIAHIDAICFHGLLILMMNVDTNIEYENELLKGNWLIMDETDKYWIFNDSNNSNNSNTSIIFSKSKLKQSNINNIIKNGSIYFNTKCKNSMEYVRLIVLYSGWGINKSGNIVIQNTLIAQLNWKDIRRLLVFICSMQSGQTRKNHELMCNIDHNSYQKFWDIVTSVAKDFITKHPPLNAETRELTGDGAYFGQKKLKFGRKIPQYKKTNLFRLIEIQYNDKNSHNQRTTACISVSVNDLGDFLKENIFKKETKLYLDGCGIGRSHFVQNLCNVKHCNHANGEWTRKSIYKKQNKYETVTNNLSESLWNRDKIKEKNSRGLIRKRTSHLNALYYDKYNAFTDWKYSYTSPTSNTDLAITFIGHVYALYTPNI